MNKYHTNCFWFIFLILVLASSCSSKEIEIDMPEIQPHIVVNSLFAPWSYTTPNPLKVYVEKSTSFFDSSKNVYISNAMVKLTTADSVLTELVYVDSLGYYTNNGEGTSGLIDFKSGVNYKLIVALNDTIVTAVDRIPYKTELNSIQIIPYAGMNENEFIFSKVSFTIIDNIDEMNYYEIQLSNNNDESLFYITSDDPVITTEPSYPSSTSIGTQPPIYLLFNDNTFNGQSKNISIYYKPPVSTEKDKIMAHVLEIRLLSISESYYKYRSSQIIQKQNKEVDILYGQAEPINVYSNVFGGFGIFAAYNIVSRTFVINDNGVINE